MHPFVLQALAAEHVKDILAAADRLAQANGAPALGSLEAGTVAAISTPAISVISGGLCCILGTVLLARSCPPLRRARFPVAADGEAVVRARPGVRPRNCKC